MTVDARQDPATPAGALARVAGQLGVNLETLGNWVTQAEIDGKVRPDPTTEEAWRIAELERQAPELRRANESLETASAFSPRRSSTADWSVMRAAGLRGITRANSPRITVPSPVPP
jgi:transposase